MNAINKSRNGNLSRGRFLNASATTLAVTQLALVKSADAQAVQTGSHTSFASLRQINAGLLNVGYAESGPSTGPAVILLHGWPYDIHSFVDVAPLLATSGYRVIVPFLRGYGTTSFLFQAQRFETASRSVVALDVIALMDALKIEKATVGGFDWGARTACIVAALWPQRCKALVSVSGYLIGNRAAALKPLAPKAELGWWYQYYFATENGLLGYTQNRYEFDKLIWSIVSPTWHFDDATYDHYRGRLQQSGSRRDRNPRLPPGESGSGQGRAEVHDDYRSQTRCEVPLLPVPTITISSDFDGPKTPSAGKAYAKKFAKASTRTGS